MQEFEEAKEKFEKSLSELRNKLKEETAHNVDLSEKSEILTRDNDTLKTKLDKLEKEKVRIKNSLYSFFRTN
jgi:predicted nuclease with TOPRIM domain